MGRLEREVEGEVFLLCFLSEKRIADYDKREFGSNCG